MKLKLAQRMAMGYYQTKFRLLSLISNRKAAESAFELFCTPYSGKPERKIPAIFHSAEKLAFKIDDLGLSGWKWKPEKPNHKKILIVHGFDSCSYRFNNFIQPLTSKGFEVMAFDAPGHGVSDGKTINALQYSQTILKAEELFGSFHAIMAHSLGGLAAALAFEQLPQQENRKLVLIAPNTETTTAIEHFFRHITMPARVQQVFYNLIEEIGRNPLPYFSVSRCIRNIKAPTLWIHDEEDQVCPYYDVLPVRKSQLPQVEFFITKGLGHSGIYRHQDVFEKIIAFLS